jgi:hypothetical protein
MQLQKKYSLKRDTEGNFKSVIKINHILSSASVFAWVRVAHLLVLCVVLLCFVTFRVPCCDVRYDFHIKTMFRSSLTVVCRRVRVLLTLFVFVCA